MGEPSRSPSDSLGAKSILWNHGGVTAALLPRRRSTAPLPAVVITTPKGKGLGGRKKAGIGFSGFVVAVVVVVLVLRSEERR